MALDRQKASMAAQVTQARQQDMASKANERQQMQSFKMAQPVGGARR
jgi:hypothetical protein